MYKISLSGIAGQLSVGNESLTDVETLSIADEIATSIVNVFNLRSEPGNADLFWSEVARFERNLDNNIGVEQSMQDTFNALNNWALQCGYDPRVKISIFSRDLKALKIVRVRMDLDATVEFINARNSISKTSLADLINDNPTSEELDAIQNSIDNSQKISSQPRVHKGKGMRAVPVSLESTKNQG